MKTGMPARYPIVIAVRISEQTDRALRRRALEDDRRLGPFLRRQLERLADVTPDANGSRSNDAAR
jgi:hypothetical protein